MSDVEARTAIRSPERRTCERCGRSERWNPTQQGWQVVTENETPQAGRPQCIHEWNITGTFSPVE
ncbi:HEWD family protein [Halovivax limisalsi]|uniref:HEWD family protein n=1 Tax=Halovivax limisalsi TaxID=1453760 RepID=UPI001FFD6FEE|nr:HEWD family protein [Halovivax limisalsi]